MAPLIAALALLGIVAGFVSRGLIFEMSVPAGSPRRTACPGCRTRVVGSGRSRWLGLPLSGRCPGCRRRLGPPPAVVELTTGGLLVLAGLLVRPVAVLAAVCWLVVCAVPAAWIDWSVRRLPDALTAAAYCGVLALMVVAGGASGNLAALGRAALGGLVLAGAYVIAAVISPNGVGLGDAKAAASAGTLLAWFGWVWLLTGTFAGFALAAVYGIVLLMGDSAPARRRIPFGPFLFAGALLVIFLTA